MTEYRKDIPEKPGPHDQVAPEWAEWGTAPGEGVKVRDKKNRQKILGSTDDGQAQGVDFDPFE